MKKKTKIERKEVEIIEGWGFSEKKLDNFFFWGDILCNRTSPHLSLSVYR